MRFYAWLARCSPEARIALAQAMRRIALRAALLEHLPPEVRATLEPV